MRARGRPRARAAGRAVEERRSGVGRVRRRGGRERRALLLRRRHHGAGESLLPVGREEEVRRRASVRARGVLLLWTAERRPLRRGARGGRLRGARRARTRRVHLWFGLCFLEESHVRDERRGGRAILRGPRRGEPPRVRRRPHVPHRKVRHRRFTAPRLRRLPRQGPGETLPRRRRGGDVLAPEERARRVVRVGMTKTPHGNALC
mmetsp:Transcript_27541/g.82910  ORF Transcript_27541/g.82910 Transcript_27541/m.82910 type:complete len:205 (-) Transcript_27541:25-639(-)